MTINNMDEQQINKIIDEKLKDFILIDKYTFQKHIQIFNGRNIQLGKSVGTQLGTETTQKLGFLGTTPIVQQSAISKPSGGDPVDTQARASIDLIIDLIQNFGLSA